MTSLKWSIASICWKNMAQGPLDPRNHIRAWKQANGSLGSFFYVIYHGNLSSCFMLRGYWVWNWNWKKWRCYSQILLETHLNAFLHHNHINPFDSRAGRFWCLPVISKALCDCKMYACHFAAAENKDQEVPFLKATWPRGISIRNGALMSARFWHASEQKSDSPFFVDFQQSIHDLQTAAFAAVSKESDLCY